MTLVRLHFFSTVIVLSLALYASYGMTSQESFVQSCVKSLTLNSIWMAEIISQNPFHPDSILKQLSTELQISITPQELYEYKSRVIALYDNKYKQKSFSIDIASPTLSEHEAFKNTMISMLTQEWQAKRYDLLHFLKEAKAHPMPASFLRLLRYRCAWNLNNNFCEKNRPEQIDR